MFIMRAMFRTALRLAWVVALSSLAGRLLPAQDYFPPGSLDKTPQGHELKAAWFSKQLKAMREPSLWELSKKDPKAEVYRFLWLRAADHPVAIRVVVRAGGSAWLNSRMTTGKGASDPGHITRYSVSWLRKKLTQEFLDETVKVGFQSMPTLSAQNDATAGMGGSEWIVEGIKDGQYHVVVRHSPDVADPVREIGLLALKLGRFNKSRTGPIC